MESTDVDSSKEVEIMAQLPSCVCHNGCGACMEGTFEERVVKINWRQGAEFNYQAQLKRQSGDCSVAYIKLVKWYVG